MAKFEKFKNLQKLAKERAKAGLVKHKEKAASGIVRHGFRFGSHAVFGLATKAMPDGLFGVSWIKPDIVGTTLSGIASIFTKNLVKKGAQATALGGMHAILGRWIASGSISVVSGPDGKLHFG